ncbi:MAG: hypothetical protein EAX86_03730 [Candidatus Heimdallarchaeota archaeon]|nr:hypothetical protein [Candidatus Heimdallarchaeota archaeon]
MTQNKKPQNQIKSAYYFETVDLVIIALFAALGGAFSAYIGNLGRIIFGSSLPGGGQLFSGLHIFWYVLIFYFTNQKKGVVTTTGIIKGFIEIFSSSSLGIMALIIAFASALIFEVCFFVFSNFMKTKRLDHLLIAISAGFASASNVIIQLETFFASFTTSNIPSEWIFVMFAFSFISGVVLGGYLGYIAFKLFENSNLLTWRKIKENSLK